MNISIITGFLTRDIELRYLQSGLAVGKTAIASTRKFTSNGEKKEETLFIDVDFFSRSAETANQYLRKGSKVALTGRLVYSSWTDNNGIKKNAISLAVESMEMLDTKPAVSDTQIQVEQQLNDKIKQLEQQLQDTLKQLGNNATPINVDEDEIPF